MCGISKKFAIFVGRVFCPVEIVLQFFLSTRKNVLCKQSLRGGKFTSKHPVPVSFLHSTDQPR